MSEHISPVGKSSSRTKGSPLFLLSGWMGLASVFSLANAVEIEQLEVRHAGEDYSVSISARLDAPLPQIWAVLTDYAALSQLSPSINESIVLETRDASTHRVQTSAKTCVLIFCKEFNQLMIFRAASRGDLFAQIEPETSDFEYGLVHWRLSDTPSATRLVFEATLRPAFWVPPIIGPWAIKRALRVEAEATCEGLERRALQSSP